MAFRRWLPLVPAAVLASLSQAAPVPLVRSIGPEETISGAYIERPAVSTDSLGEPHMVCDAGGNTSFLKFHRINGRWTGGVFAVGSRDGRYSASRLYVGQIEIDSRDRAWISCKFGIKEYGSMYGQGIWLFRNVTSAPVEQFFRFVSVYKGMGLVTTDAKYPDQGVVIGTFGNYAILLASGQTAATGSLNAGPGGEKVRARIASYAPRFGAPPGASYADGLWHTAMNGYSLSSSKYQNSTRYKAGLGPVEWAAYAAYPEQGSDFSHPGLGIDLANPRLCYLGSVFNGRLCINIWDGSRMRFPTTALKVLDYSATYEIRHGPAFTPAPDGGAFVFWTSGGRIKMAYVAPDGQATPPTDVTAGRSPAAATDRFGDLHLVYSANGPRYRKISLSRLAPLAPAGRIADSRRPAFSWTSTLAAAYTLSLERDGAPFRTVTTATNRWQPDADLPAGSYAWSVREGGPGVESAWTRPLAFAIPPLVPIPDTPAGRLKDADPNPPLFAWTQADPDATTFKAVLYRDGDKIGQRTTAGSSLAWPDALPPGTYAWRVRAIRQAGGLTVSGDWSPLQPFQVEVPGACAVLEPAALQLFPPGKGDIACAWSPADGADSYTLTLLHNDRPLAAVTGVTGTAHTFTFKANPGYLTLFVQPVNDAGAGPASPGRTFIVNRIMTPANSDPLPANALFSWTRSPKAESYLFRLARFDVAKGKFREVHRATVPAAKSNPMTWRCGYAFTAGLYRWTVTDYAGTTAGFTSSALFIVP